MTSDKSRHHPGASEGEPDGQVQANTPQSAGQTNMQWVTADVTRLEARPNGIALVFGTKQADQTAAQDVRVRASERIVLSHAAARQLSQTLDRVIQEYERAFGTLSIDGEPEPDTVRATK